MFATMLVVIQLVVSVVVGLYFFRQLRQSRQKEPAHGRESNREMERMRHLRSIHLSEPLAEKVRPTKMSDVIGQEDGIRSMKAILCGANPQHVLIYGPPGIGKTCAARLVLEAAKQSQGTPFREDAPFIEVDATCVRFDERAIADPLIGSVHDPIYQGAGQLGAQGVPQPKPGAVTKAHGGVLFLDEIGNLSLPMQSKLLTAIEKRQINRLGSTQTVPIDVRLICATNADIRQLVDEGNFRQDLLYRINTIEIHIPPLRERGNDIILLAEYFLQRYARKYKKDMRGLTREAKNKLLKYAWPGNVRELQHTIERAVILGDGSLLKPENFLFHASPKQRKEEEMILNLEQLERQTIEKAMKLSEGNISRAAEYLGITRFALYRKLEKLGL